MALTIGSNIASLQSQRRLFDTSEKLATVFERLASGQRINRASDDAAGLAISESLRTDGRVFTQAVRNLNDGQSVLNIADSTVEELSSIVIRIRELATQSASGSLSNQQRESLNSEAQELREEFFRVSREAEFNGLKLFDGSIEGGLRLQGGYGVDGSIFSSLGGELGDGTFTQTGSYTNPSGRSTEVELADFNNDGIFDMISGGISVDRIEVRLGVGDGTFGDAISYTALRNSIDELLIADFNNDGLLDVAAPLGNANGDVEILLGNGDGTFSQGDTFTIGGGDSVAAGDVNGDGNVDLAFETSSGNVNILLGGGDGTFEESLTLTVPDDVGDLVLGDIDGDGVLDLVTSNDSDDTVTTFSGNGDGTFSLVQGIAVGSTPGQIELADFNNDGALDVVLIDEDDERISLLFGNGDGTLQAGITQSVLNPGIAFEIADFNGDGFEDIVVGGSTGSSILLGDGEGSFDRSDINSLTAQGFAVGDIDGDGVYDIVIGEYYGDNYTLLGNSREGINPLLEFSLSTQADALQALAPLENKLSSLTAQRGVIGAFQSRLETATNTLQGTTENYAAAEARIRDADIAAESANLTRLNILRQASASVLAQANLQPSLSLALLS